MSKKKVSKKRVASTKTPSVKKGSGTNPASRAGDANLIPGRHYDPDIPKPYPSAWEDFIIEYKLRGNIKRAAMECHISNTTAIRILRDPRTLEVMQRLEEEIRAKKIELAAERFVIEESDVDEAMFDILKNGQTHEYKGDEARVNAGIAIYKRMKLIEPARIVNNNSAQAAALTAGPPPNLPNFFVPQWRKAILEAKTFAPEHQMGSEVGPSEHSPKRVP